MQYNIHGDNMPVVICSLDDGESMICEAGAMSWMTPNMQMETKSGGAGKLFGRVFSGESAFQNYYTARNGSGLIAFASNFPGDILAVEVTPEKPVIIQKRAFLACTTGVQMEVVFQKKLGTAIFGGEGFIMQKLSGDADLHRASGHDGRNSHNGHSAGQGREEYPLRRRKHVQHRCHRSRRHHPADDAHDESDRGNCLKAAGKEQLTLMRIRR